MENDLISRQEALALAKDIIAPTEYNYVIKNIYAYKYRCIDPDELRELPSADPTLYDYNVKHLAMIAEVLKKENIPPEKIAEVLTDIGKIVAIICDEFEELLRKAVEQCMI